MRLQSASIALIASFLLLTVKAKAQWDSVGNRGFTSSTTAYSSVAVNSAGIPYVSFYDGSVSNKATVMSYNSGSWSAVGAAGISSGTASYTSLTLDDNDTPYVAYEDGGKSKAIVKKYNGSSWVFVGDSTGISTGSASYTRLAFNKNNELYLAYYDGGISYKAVVRKYNSGTGNWDTVGTAGFSASSVNYLSLTFDTSGLPYVAYTDGGYGSKTTVMRDSSNVWVLVGSAGFSTNISIYSSIAIDGNNVPYVAYSDRYYRNKLIVMKYSGGSWSAVGASTGITSSNTAYNYMRIDSHNIPYVAYEDYGTSDKATVLKYTGGSWSAVGSAGFSGGAATYTSLAIDNNNNLYVGYADGSRSGKATVMEYNTADTWDGSSWSNGTPADTLDAVIASSIAPSSFSCHNLYINSGGSLNTGTSVVVTVKGNLINNGNGISGSGTLKFNKSGTSNISGNTVKFGGKIQVLSGDTLKTNNLLILTSDATNTGSIGQSAGTISGNVGMQRYVPGKRCFRFFGHPFTDSIALSQLTDSIDITGSGGSTNGFTTTPTNNPSAFWFDPTLADTSTTGTNPGWVAFTSATTQSWKQYQLLRLLVRGAKGEGLSGTTYTPSAATFQASGPVNQGTQTITLTKGTNSEFVGCGNPYPSGVDMSLLVLGSNVGANYYAWDATSGTSGAYVTNAFSLSYVLPSFSAFFTTVSDSTNNTIEFDESSKADGGASIYKTTAPTNWVELQLADSNTHWDRLLVKLDDKAADTIDRQDAIKLYNPGLDFYTLSKEGKRLAIDARPYTDNASIPLGLTAYKMYRHYVIKTGMYNIPAGTKLYLHDKYLSKTEELTSGYQYWFEVTSDSNSQGVNRFELNMVGQPTTGVAATTIQSNKLQIVPNPAHSSIELNYGKQNGNVAIQIVSMTGQVVYSTNTSGNSGHATVPIENLAAGTYIVELKGANLQLTEKFIKE